MDKKKMSLTTKMILVCAAAAGLIIVLMLILSIKPTIHLEKYVTIEFSGYDTVGTATASIDYAKIAEDYEGKLKTDSQLSSYGFEIALYAVASGSLDKREGLTNGDTVTYTWQITGQEEFESRYGCKLSYKDITETVSGLEKANVYDPFADVKVSFDGISSLGRATVDYSGASVKGLVYTLSKQDELSNGDEVKLVVSAPYGRNLEEYCISYGYVPGETEKTYTVSGLQEPEEFNPFDSIEVKFSGVSSLGKAEISKGTEVVSGLSYTMEPKEKLSNGDEVKVTVSAPYGQDLKEYCVSKGYTPTATEKTYTVSGLDEAKEFDPFEGVEIVFTGTQPDGQASLNKDKVILSDLSYSIDKNRNLSNGDEITVTVTGPWGADLEAYCLERGYIPTETEKTYTVEGLNAYVTELALIDETSLDKMNEQAKDAFEAYVAKNWKESESLKKFTLIGNYFLTVKDEKAYNSTRNSLYFVYEVSVENSDGKLTYYYFTRYKNIMLLADGTLSFDLSDYDTPFDRFNKKSYYYYGYEKLDTLFSKCVTAQADKYSYESTVKEKK